MILESGRKTALLSLIVFALAVCLAPNAVRAQESKPLSVEDALNTHRFGETSFLEFSPDGNWVAYMVQDNQRTAPGPEDDDRNYVRTGVSGYEQAGDIWISNSKTGEARNITRGKGSSWGARWSPDGRVLAFVSDRDGSGQARLWFWDMQSGASAVVSNVNIRAGADSRMYWTPDSKKILVTIVPEGFSVKENMQRVFFPSAAKTETESVHGSTVVVYQSDALQVREPTATAVMTNLDAQFLRDLVLVDVATGTVTNVAHGHRIGWYSVSPNGQRIAYTVPKRFSKAGSWQESYDIVDFDLRTGQEQVFARDVLLVDRAAWSPDGSYLSYAAYREDDPRCDVFVLSVKSGVLQKLPGPADETNPGGSFLPLWDRDGEFFYFAFDGALWRSSRIEQKTEEIARIPGRRIMAGVSQGEGLLWASDDGTRAVVVTHDDAGKQDGFYKIDLATGLSTPLFEAGQAYVQWPFFGTANNRAIASPDGKLIVYISEDAGHAPDLWVNDAGFRKPQRLTHLNPQLDQYKFGTSRLVDRLSDDGVPLRGALLLPANYREGKRYPLLVWVYPKLLSNELNSFGLGEFPGPFNMQLFATRGYAVLFPDVLALTPMTELAKCVLPGVNKVIELGIADSERVGVIGHSQGGTATLELIVETHRFKAAVEAAGSGDATSDFGTLFADGTGYQYLRGQERFGGSPWQYPQKYLQNSPVYYLDAVETPLLIVQGTNDLQSATSQADEMFVGLRVLNRKVEYARYERESHTPSEWSYLNQKDLACRLIIWLDRYLRPDAK